MSPTAEVAVIGGTGFYSFLDGYEEHGVATRTATPRRPSPWARSPAEASLRFPPRHAAALRYPHQTPCRADNMRALRSLGVRQVVAPCAVGGLRGTSRPAMSWCRISSSTGRPGAPRPTSRVAPSTPPFADPYCRRLGAVDAASEPSVKVGDAMSDIAGPRFSAHVQKRHYGAEGWTLVNMTGQPEAVLARGRRTCYAAIALVPDMDAGVEEGPRSVRRRASSCFGTTSSGSGGC